MSTLESQYKESIKLNPRADLSYEEWEKINARLVKQALVNMMKADEDLGLYDEETEPQETLEEAAEEYARKQCDDMYDNQGLTGASWGWETSLDFIAGAKWYREQLILKLKEGQDE